MVFLMVENYENKECNMIFMMTLKESRMSLPSLCEADASKHSVK